MAGLSVAEAVRISAGNNWQGFKADWLKPKPQASPTREGSKLGVHGQATANAAQKWLESKMQTNDQVKFVTILTGVADYYGKGPR